MTERPTSLRAESLEVSVPGRTLVRGLDLEVQPRQFLAILGQNGAGKTLTLQTLAGLRKPDSGRVLLQDRALSGWPRRHLAQSLALLPQDSEDAFPSRVLETALIGRHPHIPALQIESESDRALAREALDAMALVRMEDRNVASLSGGERRRLAIAQLLCQQPTYYLLDEPVNHLDPQHQLEVLRLFRRLADDGAAVVATLHDVNLAARFCDRALLLFGDGEWDSGSADDVLSEDRLGTLFDVNMETVRWRDTSLFVAAAADEASSAR